MIKDNIYKLILIAFDILVLFFLLYLAYNIRVSISGNIIPQIGDFSIEKYSFIVLIVIFVFYYEKIYKFRYDFWQESFKVIKSLFLSYIIVMALLTILKTSQDYSRLYITIFFILSLFFIPLSKRFIKRFIFLFPFFRKKVYIEASFKNREKLINELNKNWYLGLKASKNSFETIYIFSNDFSLDKLENRVSKYMKNYNIFIIPYIKTINFAQADILEYNNIRLNAIFIENQLHKKVNKILKNIIDFILLLIFLPFFIILHFIISFLIKLDSKGDIFFKQKRLGQNGKIFICYKYRTMYENQDEILDKYLKKHPEEIEYYKIYHKYKNDPRVTKIGKILRANSLDELPQVINILKREMSFVGPRPYMLNEEKKIKEKELILKVKPGITGLWQVSGRNNLTFNERIKLELWYIKNWSLWLDIVILIKTIKVVLNKVGAK